MEASRETVVVTLNKVKITTSTCLFTHGDLSFTAGRWLAANSARAADDDRDADGDRVDNYVVRPGGLLYSALDFHIVFLLLNLRTTNFVTNYTQQRNSIMIIGSVKSSEELLKRYSEEPRGIFPVRRGPRFWKTLL